MMDISLYPSLIGVRFLNGTKLCGNVAKKIAFIANFQISASGNTLKKWKPKPEKGYSTAYATTKRMKNQKYNLGRKEI
jgi:hypothetical protein